MFVNRTCFNHQTSSIFRWLLYQDVALDIKLPARLELKTDLKSISHDLNTGLNPTNKKSEIFVSINYFEPGSLDRN